ncbi:MAG: threonylcarbamoyl-AMP synthase [Puniceicoccales bacterium]|jgi:L-threonylcarbamoyladenylate synthase|nr:threonylcarbamoyl-AMP synthase [Puniceicoccales bacterium]
MEDEVFAAAEELRRGGVVVLPTETVYGLAANALDPIAVSKIFKIKGRPHSDPLIVHVLDDTWIDRYAYINHYENRIRALVESFWPGPLTLVIKKRAIIPDIVTAGFSSVAVRCPRHRMFHNVLALCDFPLAAPSANPFGYVSPTTAEQVRQTFGKKVKIIVDGGSCSVGLESTIVDISKEVPKILRPGAITAEKISSVLDEPVSDYEQIVAENPTTPGQLKQHYCTTTKLVLFQNGHCEIPSVSSGKVAIIFNKKPSNIEKIMKKLPLSIEDIFWLSENGDQSDIARNLFATMQKLDGIGYSVIFCERPKRDGIGVAIDDRLLRAAAKYQVSDGKGPCLDV